MRSLPTLALVLFLSGTSANAETVELKLKFPLGQVSKLSLSMDFDVTGSNNGVPVERHAKMQIDLKHRVTKSDQAGATVELTFERIRLTQTDSALNTKLSFDSADDKSGDTNLLDGLRIVTGKKLTLQFAADGKLDGVDGFDTIAKRVAEQPHGAAAVELAEAYFSAEQFRQTFNRNLAAALPAKPVDIGDEWKSSQNQDVGGFAIERTGHYKIAGVKESEGRKIATIDFTSDGVLKMKTPDGQVVKVGTESEKGIKRFDVAHGCFSETDREVIVQGEMKVPSPNGQVIDKFKQVVKSKVVFSPDVKN